MNWDNCRLAVTATVVTAEAGKQDNPDNPIATGVVTAAIIAAISAKNAVAAAIAPVVISVAEE